MTGKTRAKGAAATRTCAWKSRDMASPEFLQGFRDPGELLVNGRHLILQCLDLRSGEGIDRADRDAAGGTLHQHQLAAFAERREQRQLETVSGAFSASRNGHSPLPEPIA